MRADQSGDFRKRLRAAGNGRNGVYDTEGAAPGRWKHSLAPAPNIFRC